MSLQARVDSQNSITSAHEVYEWLQHPPTRYFAYVKVTRNAQGYSTGSGVLTTWTGDILGTVQLGRRYSTGGFARSTRRSITVVGTNGVKYHGTYYESSGDYCRIKRNK
jgi:hypothetical protein